MAVVVCSITQETKDEKLKWIQTKRTQNVVFEIKLTRSRNYTRNIARFNIGGLLAVCQYLKPKVPTTNSQIRVELSYQSTLIQVNPITPN